LQLIIIIIILIIIIIIIIYSSLTDRSCNFNINTFASAPMEGNVLATDVILAFGTLPR
jgi:hypothetical protein